MLPYEKPPKKDDIDDFWDIADMLPERKKSKKDNDSDKANENNTDGEQK